MSKKQTNFSIDALPDLPLELRAARIGTCYNPYTRSLISGRIAVDPEKLNKTAINFVGGKGSLKLRANASSAQNMKDSMFSVSTKAKLGSFGELSFDMSSALTEKNVVNDLNCFCTYAYTETQLRLKNLAPKSLFNYMTDDFQTSYDELMDAAKSKDKKKVFLLYKEFLDNFGYGCVTALLLSSGSAFRVTANYGEKSGREEQKYGGSVSVGYGGWGVSAAGEFASATLDASSQASMDITATYVPENTPTRDWCNSLMGSFADMGMEKLKTSASFIEGHSYSGEKPIAPDIPEQNPDKKELPNGEVNNITEELQQSIMKEDNFKGTWAEYEAEQQKLYEELTSKKVVKENVKRLSRLLAMNINLKKPSIESRKKKIIEYTNTIDLGDYVPTNYEIKLWQELFPALKNIDLLCSMASLYLSRSYLYYLTRLEFSTYLQLLNDMEMGLVNSQDLEQYNQLCSNLYEVVVEQSFNPKDYSADIYDQIVADFEQKIRNLQYFDSLEIYTTFFEHYEFFSDQRCGFAIAWTEDGSPGVSYFSKYGIERSIVSPNDVSLSDLMVLGLRFYAVLEKGTNGDIQLKMASYSNYTNPNKKNWSISPALENGFDEIQHKDTRGQCYYVYQCPFDDYKKKPKMKEVRLYGAGEKVMQAIRGKVMSGVPMIHTFSTDALLNYAKIKL